MSYFLGADQGDGRVRLFSNTYNEQKELFEDSVWRYPRLDLKPRFKPTDAKRVDNPDGNITVIIATHGCIYEVPYMHKAKVVFTETYRSCHSVEKLPDGNYISVSSTPHNKIIIHYNKIDNGNHYLLKDAKEYRLRFGHGVVYDKKRDCIWALGTTLKKYKYIGGDEPSLKLIKKYKIPEISGHDLFPSRTGNLFLTTNKSVYMFHIRAERFQLFSDLDRVKSVAEDAETGELYVTAPRRKVKLGYKRWQTDMVTNLHQSIQLIRPKAKFYKVRLWQKNPFSY